MLRLFCIYFILSIQYSFNGASPLFGPSVVAVPPGKFRFIVSLINKTRLPLCRTSEHSLARELAHECGGSLITPYHVLTAAHCVNDFDGQFNEVEVAIGSTDLRAVTDVRGVSWWTTYSKFMNVTFLDKKKNNMKENLFDIAIIKLDTPVEDVELPTISYIPTEELYNKSVVIAGWGRIEEDEKAIHMRMGTFTIINPWENLEKYKTEKTVGSYRLYTKVLAKIRFYTDALTTRTRPADSGSPVLLYNGGSLKYPNNIIGINRGTCYVQEEGVLCQRLDIHTSVYVFRDFIESVTKITDDNLLTV